MDRIQLVRVDFSLRLRDGIGIIPKEVIDDAMIDGLAAISDCLLNRYRKRYHKGMQIDGIVSVTPSDGGMTAADLGNICSSALSQIPKGEYYFYKDSDRGDQHESETKSGTD